MISLISIRFPKNLFPLLKLLFQHGQGRQNTKENKAFYHYTESKWVLMKNFTVQSFELYFRKLGITSHSHSLQHYLEILIEREDSFGSACEEFI